MAETTAPPATRRRRRRSAAPTFADAFADLRECREVAKRLVEAANTDTDRLLALQCFIALADEIDAVLLNQLQQSTAAYKGLTEAIKNVKGKLQKLKDRIDEIIVAVEEISRFVGIVNRVITLLGTVGL